MRRGGGGQSTGRASYSESVRRLDRIVAEHLDGVERILVEGLADEAELLEDVRRGGDDVAADRIGLDEVQELPRTGPEQLDVRLRTHQLEGGRHERHGVAPGVGDASREDRDDARVARQPALRSPSRTWGSVSRAVTLSFMPFLSQLPDERPPKRSAACW